MGKRAPAHPKIKYITFQVGAYFEKYELRNSQIVLISTNAPQGLLPNLNPKVPKNSPNKEGILSNPQIDISPIDESITIQTLVSNPENFSHN